MNVISKLQSYRLKHGLSQEDLATKLGVRFVTLNRWLNRKVEPNEINLHKIKQLLSGRK